MPLKSSVLGAAFLAVSYAVSCTPAMAADLMSGDSRGSYKDSMPAPAYRPAGPCYVRADVGYSVSQNPSVKWPVSSIDNTTSPATTTFITDIVANVSLENTWLAEGGVGCQIGGGGSRAFRVEAVLGYHGERALQGEPGNFTVTGGGNPGNFGGIVDPLHTRITSYTAMLNAYKDLGSYYGLVPYVGAGVGLAYNELRDVSFTGNPNLTNVIEGGNTVSFAWSAMAGVGYQVSDRTIIDVGYRYLDLGAAQSGRVDTLGYVNPRVTVADYAAHEFKVGLRYHFDGNGGLGTGAMK